MIKWNIIYIPIPEESGRQSINMLQVHLYATFVY